MARFIESSAVGAAKNERKKLVVYPVSDSADGNIASVLRCDSENRLWCGTYAGLYRGDVGQDGEMHFTYSAQGGSAVWTNAAFADSQNHLWFGLAKDFIEVDGERVTPRTLPHEVSGEEIAAITADPQGRLLVASLTGVSQYRGAGDGRGGPDGGAAGGDRAAVSFGCAGIGGGE